jgi:hypothetical protein
MQVCVYKSSVSAVFIPDEWINTYSLWESSMRIVHPNVRIRITLWIHDEFQLINKGNLLLPLFMGNGHNSQ